MSTGERRATEYIVPDHQSIMLTTHVSAIGLKFDAARLQSKPTRAAKFF
jgi:hypothetical protein